jgi:hypothetical protein
VLNFADADAGTGTRTDALIFRSLVLQILETILVYCPANSSVPHL